MSLPFSNPSQQLSWLPAAPADWKQQFLELRTSADPWSALLALSNFQLDFLATTKIDRELTRLLQTRASVPSHFTSLRLAILASSTTHHLLPSLRISALRRGILLNVYEGGYGQYMQELADRTSALHAFHPQVILFALDAHHLVDLASAGTDPTGRARQAWQLARQNTTAALLQQTVLPLFAPILGSNEHRLPSSPQSILAHFNHAIALAADEAHVHLLDITTPAAHDGLSIWHDPALWLRSKHEVHPAAAPLYGEALAPVLAAHLGLSRKCLVLDLDNTLWGGVIGDDGIEGIHLGHGHAAGEAFLDFQSYCLRLRDRGILLAVCSKNEESTALIPFTQHAETLLRREHFACFFANWQDKPANLRAIAEQLNIGLDALVFADDNPFERNLVRRELPEVAVPELPEDPAHFASTIARAGYFEALALTPEDAARAAQYQANAARISQLASATDLDSYLLSLNMELRHRAFDEANLTRIAQLIGKTNQFNVTTRRRSADDLRRILATKETITLQLALSDSFGDNGTIAAVIAHAQEGDLVIDTWLMSCRVLGRRVEDATLALLVHGARQRGLNRILGELIPTPKNLPVRDLYARLGFTPIETPTEAPSDTPANTQWFSLELSGFEEKILPFTLLEG